MRVPFRCVCVQYQFPIRIILYMNITGDVNKKCSYGLFYLFIYLFFTTPVSETSIAASVVNMIRINRVLTRNIQCLMKYAKHKHNQ